MSESEFRPMAAGSEGARRMRTVNDLRTGDDACFIGSDEKDWESVIVSFVRAGLDERQRILYLHDARSPDAIRAVLRQAEIDVDHAEFREQLVFMSARQLYCRGAGYSFERVLDQLHAMTAMALADGWSALRITTEMTWVLRQTQGFDHLLAQEGRMVGFFRDNAALGLSQYDRSKFPAGALIDVLLAHPLAVLDTEAVHNFYYTPEVDGAGAWRSQGTLDRWLSNLKERKRASENLREALQLQHEILDNVGSGIVVLDRAGRIVQCNPFVERFLGLSGLEMQGRRLAEFLPDFGGDRLDDVLARVLRGEAVLSPDLNVMAASNASWVIATLAPYRDPDGQIIGAIAAVSDISSRKAVEAALRASEEQLRQTQKLDAVGRLAGGVAHDMNNALNAIIAFADLALQGAGDDQDLCDDIGEIRLAAERAASITRRLLAFSRRQVLQPQIIAINTIIGNVEAMVRRLMGDSIRLSVRLAPDAGWVKSDPAQIEQVIINLALNARDAMPSGGTLAIETDIRQVASAESVPLDTIEAGDYAVIRISDTGCGMPPEILAHVFEPFFSTKNLARGSGLGLPVVYGIVKQSGGHIRIHSEVGKGTGVEVFLARTSPPGDAATNSEGSPGDETLLLVEDEDVVRKVVARILERAGYHVLVASNAAEAIALCERTPTRIDALVSDIVMPGMSGKELADVLVSRCAGLRVLFMTGYTDDEYLRRGVLDAGRAMIVKPFSPRDLLHALREVLAKQ